MGSCAKRSGCGAVREVARRLGGGVDGCDSDRIGDCAGIEEGKDSVELFLGERGGRAETGVKTFVGAVVSGLCVLLGTTASSCADNATDCFKVDSANNSSASKMAASGVCGFVDAGTVSTTGSVDRFVCVDALSLVLETEISSIWRAGLAV